MDNLGVLMKKFNFTEYETKVYTTLLKIGASTGYEISKMSNVPRSKVYNILETLAQKGVVSKSSGQTTLYCALPVDDLILALRKEKEQELNQLEVCLKDSVSCVHESNEIWNLDGYGVIVSKLKNLIRNANDEFYIQIWMEDLDDELIELLCLAERRISKFVCILFSEKHEYKIGLNRYYAHYFEHEKLEEMRSRWINVVSDGSMFLATVYSKENANAVSTSYGPMVLLAKEYVKHDAYTARILELLDASALAKLGKDKSLVRDIYK